MGIYWLKLILFLISMVLIYGQVKDDSSSADKKEEILPPCQACKTIANSFLKGMAKTNKKHFGGGDTAWEEEKLGDYAQSEVRLIEIQESICSDVVRGQHQCYSLAEKWEQRLEDWWFKHQKTDPDLIKWLCIETLEYCCPDNFYGPTCQPCQGQPNNICNNNGKCKGSGTRKGNGECSCNEGYKGATCGECSDGFYLAYKDNQKILCSKCHNSCLDACTGPGPKGCLLCKPGWFKDSKGCLDVNECIGKNPCKANEFCVNNDGSYTCLVCDKACDGCLGDGPDMCEKCSEGYTFRDGMCIGKKEWSGDLDNYRYLTYIGLCIATVIIFQKKPFIAGVIGLMIALYVYISENMLSSIKSQLSQDVNSFVSTNT